MKLPFKTILVFLFGVVPLTVLSGNRALRAEDSPDLKILREVIPDASEVKTFSEPFRYWAAYQTDPDSGRKIFKGFAFLTTDLAPDITGYHGPIKILAAVDLTGRILAVKILDHRETIGFMHGINRSSWLLQFTGLGPGSRIRPGGDIDAVSGATITVRAITAAIEQSLEKMRVHVLAQGEPFEENKKPPAAEGLYQTGVLILLFLLAAAAHLKNYGRLRTALIVFSFFFLGLHLKLFFSVSHLTAFLTRSLPGFQIAALLWLFFLLLVLSSAAFGRLYCGYLCPFGALQELIIKVSPKKFLVRPRGDVLMKKAKFPLLGILLLAAVLYPGLRAAHYEPFTAFFIRHALALVWIFTGLMIVSSFFVERFYCRYFCLAGAALALAAKGAASGLTILEDPVSPPCKLCEQVCPMQTIRDGKIDREECVLCGRCRQVCPGKAVRLKPAPFFGKKL